MSENEEGCGGGSKALFLKRKMRGLSTDERGKREKPFFLLLLGFMPFWKSLMKKKLCFNFFYTFYLKPKKNIVVIDFSN